MNGRITEENRKQREIQYKNFVSLTGMTERQMEDLAAERFAGAWSELTASQKRGRLLSDQFLRSYGRSPEAKGEYQLVGWRSLFMPTEIMYAMGIMPLTVEMTAAQLAMMGLAVGRLETAEGNGYVQDICSFIKTGGGAVIEDILPSPDILLTSTHICDPSAKFAMYAAHKYNRPEFVLDIPYSVWSYGPDEEGKKRYEDAVSYVADQLGDMVRFISSETGAVFDEAKLIETIELANEARKWFLLGYKFLLEEPGAVQGSKDMDYAVNLMQTWGTEQIVDVYKSRYDELRAAAKKKSAAGEKPKVRWAHLRPYYANTLIDYIEEKADIIGSHVNYIYWDEMDARDPFRELARKTVLTPTYCQVGTRSSLILQAMNKGEGLIAFYPKSCRHYHSSARMEQETFKKNGIPMLILDSDCIDNRGDDFLIQKTRIDRFLKSLEQGQMRV